MAAKRTGDGLTKLSPGKWSARITYTRPDGRRVDTDRTIKANTKAEALAERDRILRELKGEADAPTLDEALDLHLDGKAFATAAAYRSALRVLDQRTRAKRLPDLSAVDVQRALRASASPAMGHLVLSALQGAYRTARRAHLYAGPDPFAQVASPRKTAPVTTPEERLAALEGEGPRRAYRPEELRAVLEQLRPDLRLLTVVQVLLGCRFGEVSALRVRDVDWATGDVTIRRGQYKRRIDAPKTRRRRTTALGRGGLALVRAHAEQLGILDQPDALLLPGPGGRMWSYEYVRDLIRAAQTAAGVVVAARTHAARHTHVTSARRLKADALLGAMVGQTPAMVEHYTDETQQPRQEYAEGIEALVGAFVGIDEPTTRKD